MQLLIGFLKRYKNINVNIKIIKTKYIFHNKRTKYISSKSINLIKCQEAMVDYMVDLNPHAPDSRPLQHRSINLQDIATHVMLIYLPV